MAKATEGQSKPGPALWTISSACTSCGNCVQVCPTESIFFSKTQFHIDTATCDEHKICVRVCPVDAIYSKSKYDSS